MRVLFIPSVGILWRDSFPLNFWFEENYLVFSFMIHWDNPLSPLTKDMVI